MVKIPVKLVRSHSFANYFTLMGASVVFVFLFGLTGGFALGVYSEGHLSFPFVDSGNQLAAVGTLEQNNSGDPVTDNTVESPATQAGDTENAIDAPQTEAAPLLAPLPDTSVRINELTKAIDENELSVIRVNREIELLKNASVALISEFNQNCGNWNDECARPYATQLGDNNAHYDALAKELDRLTNTLSADQKERADLQSR